MRALSWRRTPLGRLATAAMVLMLMLMLMVVLVCAVVCAVVGSPFLGVVCAGVACAGVAGAERPVRAC